MRIRPGVPSLDPSRRRGAGAVELLLGLLLFAFAGWYGSCTLSTERAAAADDAYITYTYARNLVEGKGLRYNAGDPEPTSGCSTELHLLISAGAIGAGLDPLVATRALSLAAILALGLGLGLLASRLLGAPAGRGVLVGAAAAWIFMLLPETRVHLASGMETLLFTLVHGLTFLWAAWAGARTQRPGASVLASGALVLGALVLARPEGWMLAILYAFALVVVRLPRDGSKSSLRECTGVLVLAIGLVGGLFAWRFATFGSVLANPYYVKSANAIFGSDGALLPGMADTLRFALLRLAPAIFLVGVAGFALALEARVWVPVLALLAPSLVVLALYTRVIHEMAGGFRYEYPLLVPWIGAAAAGLIAVSLRKRAAYRAVLACAVLAVPALASPVRPAVWDYVQHPRSMASAWMDRRVPDNALSRAGRDLADTGLGGRGTILLSAAGQIPWHSRFRAIDWVGLNDTHLSGREPLTIEEVWEYLERQAPDVVQSILPPAALAEGPRERDPNFTSRNVATTLSGRGSALFQHWNRERFAQMTWSEMRWIRERCVFGACYKLGDAWGEDWWVFLYVRKDSPHRDLLLEKLSSSKRADWTSDLSRVFPFDPRLLSP